MTSPILSLDLAQAGINTIIWATGYAVDYSWLNVNAFNEQGRPQHQRGVSSEPGVYFLGLPWLSRRGQPLSGASGTTRSISPTISPPAVNIASTKTPASVNHDLLNRITIMPTHTRIRMFNTKETYPNQTLDNDLCQAVRAGNTVYVRGQVGTDFAGNLVGLGDPRAQAEQAMKTSNSF